MYIVRVFLEQGVYFSTLALCRLILVNGAFSSDSRFEFSLAVLDLGALLLKD